MARNGASRLAMNSSARLELAVCVVFIENDKRFGVFKTGLNKTKIINEIPCV
jgi:hypothetical protein